MLRTGEVKFRKEISRKGTGYDLAYTDFVTGRERWERLRDEGKRPVYSEWGRPQNRPGRTPIGPWVLALRETSTEKTG